MGIYMALGDSITAGVGATSRYCAYPWLVRSQLNQRLSLPVELKVIARSGWTSAALMTALFNQDPDQIRRANVISVWVGGDDLIKASRAILRGSSPTLLSVKLENYRRNLNSIVCGIKRISKARIVLCTQYNPFPFSPIAVSGIQSLNLITKEVSSCLGTELAPIHGAFSGHEALFIQGYNSGRIEDAYSGNTPPIHPNNYGHQAAADVIH